MRLFKYFFAIYPTRTIVALALLFLSAFVEGLSITAIIPLLASIMAERYGHSTADTPQNGAISDALEKVNAVFEPFGGPPSVTVLILIISAGILTKSFIVYYARVYVGYTSSKIAKDVRLKLLRAISNVDWNYYVKQPAGAISSALITETAMASQGYSHCIYLSSCIIQIIVYGVIAVFLSWKLAIIVFILSAILIVALHNLITISKQLGNENMMLIRSILTQLNDSLRNVKSLKAMDCQEHSDVLLYHRTKKLARVAKHIAHAQAAVISAQEPIITVSIMAGVFAALNWLNIPFEIILVILVVLMRLMKTVARAQKFYQQVIMVSGPFESVISTIDTAESHQEQLKGILSPPKWSTIQFKDVSFGHGDRVILDGCNFTIDKNKLISIIGPSGIGKTTLIDLLSGLYSPEKGSIFVEDVPMEKLNIKQWRQQIGYVTQETTLLHSTIAQNISLGNESITENDIVEALKLSEAWPFVQELPEGIHTEVGEQGSALSGGQRQRILLARAFARKPSLLILDEVTSALDHATESAISNTIRMIANSTTVISISHRRPLISISDVIYELESGKLLLRDKNDENILKGFPEPIIHSPQPNTILKDSTALVSWSEEKFLPELWAVTAGSSGHGSQDIFNTGKLSPDTTSATVANLPVDGSLITLSLYAQINGKWEVVNSVPVTAHTVDSYLQVEDIDLQVEDID